MKTLWIDRVRMRKPIAKAIRMRGCRTIQRAVQQIWCAGLGGGIFIDRYF